MNEKETIPTLRIGLLNHDGTVTSVRYKVDHEFGSGKLAIAQIQTAECLKKMIKDWQRWISFMFCGNEIKTDASKDDFLYNNTEEYCLLLFDGENWTVHINYGTDYISIGL